MLEDIISALNFAGKAHSGQFRKDGKTPYIVHPTRMFMRMSTENLPFQNKQDLKDIYIATLLHDVVEDTSVRLDDIGVYFSAGVLNIVAELTKTGTLDDYLKQLKNASMFATYIKYHDIIDNLNDLDANNHPDFTQYFCKKCDRYLEVLSDKFSGLRAEITELIRLHLNK